MANELKITEKKSSKRGPAKKAGFRQELRITPLVENVFERLKNKYDLKNNSEALNKVAEIYFCLSNTDDFQGNI